MRKKPIQLSAKDRAGLEKYCNTGVHSVKLVTRARIILALDISGGRTPERRETIAERLGISRQTVNNARRDFLAAKSLTVFLQRKQRETPPVPSKITGELEARIIMLACGKAPKGYSRWTLRLLAEKCVQLHYFGTLSHMTISRLLKKHNLNLT
ncbi:MAG: helix-turn-helix domain-containing protein [Treponema sp.]|nr:helix-turn-helix domain-containing protein [Treponema sp.]